MNNIQHTFINILALIFLFSAYSCQDFDNDVRDIALDSGQADFSRYVALGNSLTAGTQDGALYISSQEHAYPALLAQKMETVFRTPWMSDELGGMPSVGIENKLILKATLVPQRAEGIGTSTLENIFSLEKPLHNLGVPGAKTADLLLSGFGNPMLLSNGISNPYYVRFASHPNASIVEDAMAIKPTFFSIWIGANDILSYAGAGGDPSTSLTPETAFESKLYSILDSLTKHGAKGIIATLPDVTTSPYFSTIPFCALDPANTSYAAMVDLLNEDFAALNLFFEAAGYPERKLAFSKTEASPVVILDKDMEDLSAAISTTLQSTGMPAAQAELLGKQYGQARQATSDELILLPASSVIGQVDQQHYNFLTSLGIPQEDAMQLSVSGITFPLADRYVLTKHEITNINTTANAFDAIIRQAAIDYNLALYDARKHMNTLSREGITYNGVHYNADFIKGGAFSLDGVHPNNAGHALIANGFIEAINMKFQSNLPTVDVNQ